MMRNMVVMISVLALIASAPAAAQSYSGGTGHFPGLGAESTFPDHTFDIIDFGSLTGAFAGPGTYAINSVTFTVGYNRYTTAPFGGVFALTGMVGGNPVNYTVNYGGTISNADTITLGGNYLKIMGQGVHINKLTLTNGDLANPVTGVLTATVGPVPEPATWAMMIVGMGAVGGTMRRRQAAVRGTTLHHA